VLEPLGRMEVANEEDEPTGEGEGDASALAVLAVPNQRHEMMGR
jgi:hypothetical protein